MEKKVLLDLPINYWKNKVENEYRKHKFSKEHITPLATYLFFFWIVIMIAMPLCQTIIGEILDALCNLAIILASAIILATLFLVTDRRTIARHLQEIFPSKLIKKISILILMFVGLGGILFL